MSVTVNQVHSQVIPLKNINMLLPNTTVAEIIHYKAPKIVENAPAWMLGMLDWRGLQIPLISIEGTTGSGTPGVTPKSRIAVINVLNDQKDFHFFAVLTQAIPHLIKVNQSELKTLEGTDKGKFILANVQLNETRASIPDLDALETMILKTGLKFRH